ncbi:hypothetical protein AB2T90_22150 [Clostridium butyricum]|uniref:hypothetical protein n=1 Tax=Clostridium butyricum TaxID=1492 RepID=UPI0034671DD0
MEYINLEQFEKKFTENTQGYIENFTGKIIYCSYDLGFKLDLEDCLEVGDCNDCWNEVKEYLRFRDGK